MKRPHTGRSVLMCRAGAVATSQPLAARAGLRILEDGGNAIDAAVAMAATLGTVEPMSTGIGGDAFALIWNAGERKLYGLNASGRCPLALDLAECRRLGLVEVPLDGLIPVTVPGAVDGYAAALARHGTMTLAEVLQPAIHYAEEGFAVTPLIAQGWAASAPRLMQNQAAAENYLMSGRAPRAGQVFRQPNLARSLCNIAEGGRDAFYQGPIAEAIVAYCRSHGGYLGLEDFRRHQSTWVEPIATDYRGHTVYQIPPNGQGLAVLLALNIAAGFDLPSLSWDAPERYHLLIEAMKLAFADAHRYIADPEQAQVPVAELLSPRYTATRRQLVERWRATPRPSFGQVPGADTVYLTVVDRHRNAVSFINSLYHGFGSGVVAGHTGIALQNRGAGFSLDPQHPNCLAPGKRPYHTIIPGMVFRGSQPWLSYGVMGGFMQPQGHLQVVSNLVDCGMDPQQALEAPRFRCLEGAQVAVEPAIGQAVIEALAQLGHELQIDLPYGGFGGGQVIAIDWDEGVLQAGSDPRKDGCAMGY